jgi:hypothetical protein
MENSFQTSFIPKKPIVSSSGSKEPKSPFLKISTLLLVIAIFVSIVLFVYKVYLTKQEQSLSESLAIARDSFEKDTIDELELFDKRTESAKQILSKHIVFSPMFAALGNLTIPSIQYTSFEQQSNDKGYTVDMKGIASDYRSIALQADMFDGVRGRSFNGVLFSNLIKDKNNNITFDLKFNIEPEILSYQKNVLSGQVAPDNPNTVSSQLPGVIGNTTQ